MSVSQPPLSKIAEVDLTTTVNIWRGIDVGNSEKTVYTDPQLAIQYAKTRVAPGYSVKITPSFLEEMPDGLLAFRFWINSDDGGWTEHRLKNTHTLSRADADLFWGENAITEYLGNIFPEAKAHIDDHKVNTIDKSAAGAFDDPMLQFMVGPAVFKVNVYNQSTRTWVGGLARRFNNNLQAFNYAETHVKPNQDVMIRIEWRVDNPVPDAETALQSWDFETMGGTWATVIWWSIGGGRFEKTEEDYGYRDGLGRDHSAKHNQHVNANTEEALIVKRADAIENIKDELGFLEPNQTFAEQIYLVGMTLSHMAKDFQNPAWHLTLAFPSRPTLSKLVRLPEPPTVDSVKLLLLKSDYRDYLRPGTRARDLEVEFNLPTRISVRNRFDRLIGCLFQRDTRSLEGWMGLLRAGMKAEELSGIKSLILDAANTMGRDQAYRGLWDLGVVLQKEAARMSGGSYAELWDQDRFEQSERARYSMDSDEGEAQEFDELGPKKSAIEILLLKESARPFWDDPDEPESTPQIPASKTPRTQKSQYELLKELDQLKGLTKLQPKPPTITPPESPAWSEITVEQAAQPPILSEDDARDEAQGAADSIFVAINRTPQQIILREHVGGWYKGSVPRVDARETSFFPNAPSKPFNSREQFETLWLEPFMARLRQLGCDVVKEYGAKEGSFIPMVKIGDRAGHGEAVDKILKYLNEVNEPKTWTEVAHALNIPRSTAANGLKRLAESGRVQKTLIENQPVYHTAPIPEGWQAPWSVNRRAEVGGYGGTHAAVMKVLRDAFQPLSLRQIYDALSDKEIPKHSIRATLSRMVRNKEILLTEGLYHLIPIPRPGGKAGQGEAIKRVVQYLQSTKEPKTWTQVSQALGMPRTTAETILKRLSDSGEVEQTIISGLPVYHMGPIPSDWQPPWTVQRLSESGGYGSVKATVLKALIDAGQPMSIQQIVDAVANKYIPRHSIRVTLSRMVRAGEISKDGTLFYITPQQARSIMPARSPKPMSKPTESPITTSFMPKNIHLLHVLKSILDGYSMLKQIPLRGRDIEMTQSQIQQTLKELVNRGLVEEDDGVYRVHPQALKAATTTEPPLVKQAMVFPKVNDALMQGANVWSVSYSKQGKYEQWSNQPTREVGKFDSPDQAFREAQRLIGPGYFVSVHGTWNNIMPYSNLSEKAATMAHEFAGKTFSIQSGTSLWMHWVSFDGEDFGSPTSVSASLGFYTFRAAPDGKLDHNFFGDIIYLQIDPITMERRSSADIPLSKTSSSISDDIEDLENRRLGEVEYEVISFDLSKKRESIEDFYTKYESSDHYETLPSAWARAHLLAGPGKEVWVRESVLSDDEMYGRFWGVRRDWISYNGEEFILGGYDNPKKTTSSTNDVPMIKLAISEVDSLLEEVANWIATLDDSKKVKDTYYWTKKQLMSNWIEMLGEEITSVSLERGHEPDIMTLTIGDVAHPVQFSHDWSILNLTSDAASNSFIMSLKQKHPELSTLTHFQWLDPETVQLMDENNKHLGLLSKSREELSDRKIEWSLSSEYHQQSDQPFTHNLRGFIERAIRQKNWAELHRLGVGLQYIAIGEPPVPSAHDLGTFERFDRVRQKLSGSHPKLLKRSVFLDQHYSDNDGEWRVEDIHRYAVENTPIQELSVEELASNNLQASGGDVQKADELPGSPEFVDRAMVADLQYPILAVQYGDGIWIADGVHRLWKAKHLGHKTIKARLIDNGELATLPKVKESATIIPLTKNATQFDYPLDLPSEYATGKMDISVSIYKHGTLNPRASNKFGESLPAAIDFAKKHVGPGYDVWLTQQFYNVPEDHEILTNLPDNLTPVRWSWIRRGTWADIIWTSPDGGDFALSPLSQFGTFDIPIEMRDGQPRILQEHIRDVTIGQITGQQVISTASVEEPLTTAVWWYKPSANQEERWLEENDERTFPDPWLAAEFAKTRAAPGVVVQLQTHFNEIRQNGELFRRTWESHDGEEFREREVADFKLFPNVPELETNPLSILKSAQQIPLVRQANLQEQIQSFSDHLPKPTSKEVEHFYKLVDKAKRALPSDVNPNKLRIVLFPFVKHQNVDLHEPSSSPRMSEDVIALEWRNGSARATEMIGPVGLSDQRQHVFIDLPTEEKSAWTSLDSAGWIRDPSMKGRFLMPHKPPFELHEDKEGLGKSAAIEMPNIPDSWFGPDTEESVWVWWDQLGGPVESNHKDFGSIGDALKYAENIVDDNTRVKVVWERGALWMEKSKEEIDDRIKSLLNAAEEKYPEIPVHRVEMGQIISVEWIAVWGDELHLKEARLMKCIITGARGEDGEWYWAAGMKTEKLPASEPTPIKTASHEMPEIDEGWLVHPGPNTEVSIKAWVRRHNLGSGAEGESESEEYQDFHSAMQWANRHIEPDAIVSVVAKYTQHAQYDWSNVEHWARINLAQLPEHRRWRSPAPFTVELVMMYENHDGKWKKPKIRAEGAWIEADRYGIDINLHNHFRDLDPSKPPPALWSPSDGAVVKSSIEVPLAKTTASWERKSLLTDVYIKGGDYVEHPNFFEFEDPILALEFARTRAAPGVEVVVKTWFAEQSSEDPNYQFTREWISKDGEDFLLYEKPFWMHSSTAVPELMLDWSKLLKVANQTTLNKTAGDYYTFNPDTMTIEDVARKWALEGKKAYDWDGLLPLAEVWKYRDYDWTRDTARSGYIYTREMSEAGKEPEQFDRGQDKWDRFVQEMQQKGWPLYAPAHLYFGRNGKVKLGEGNHRLAIAKQLGLTEVPVRFHFHQEVMPTSEVSHEPRQVVEILPKKSEISIPLAKIANRRERALALTKGELEKIHERDALHNVAQTPGLSGRGTHEELMKAIPEFQKKRRKNATIDPTLQKTAARTWQVEWLVFGEDPRYDGEWVIVNHPNHFKFRSLVFPYYMTTGEPVPSELLKDRMVDALQSLFLFSRSRNEDIGIEEGDRIHVVPPLQTGFTLDVSATESGVLNVATTQAPLTKTAIARNFQGPKDIVWAFTTPTAAQGKGELLDEESFPDLDLAFRWARAHVGPGLDVVIRVERFELMDGNRIIQRMWISRDEGDFKESTGVDYKLQPEEVGRWNTVPYLGDFSAMSKMSNTVVPLTKQANRTWQVEWLSSEKHGGTLGKWCVVNSNPPRQFGGWAFPYSIEGSAISSAEVKSFVKAAIMHSMRYDGDMTPWSEIEEGDRFHVIPPETESFILNVEAEPNGLLKLASKVWRMEWLTTTAFGDIDPLPGYWVMVNHPQQLTVGMPDPAIYPNREQLEQRLEYELDYILTHNSTWSSAGFEEGDQIIAQPPEGKSIRFILERPKWAPEALIPKLAATEVPLSKLATEHYDKHVYDVMLFKGTDNVKTSDPFADQPRHYDTQQAAFQYANLISQPDHTVIVEHYQKVRKIHQGWGITYWDLVEQWQSVDGGEFVQTWPKLANVQIPLIKQADFNPQEEMARIWGDKFRKAVYNRLKQEGIDDPDKVDPRWKHEDIPDQQVEAYEGALEGLRPESSILHRVLRGIEWQIQAEVPRDVPDSFKGEAINWLRNQILRTEQPLLQNITDVGVVASEEWLLEMFFKTRRFVPPEKRNLSAIKNTTELFMVVQQAKVLFEEAERKALAKGRGSKFNEIAAKTTDLIYQDDEWQILRPRSKESAITLGTGTNWCTSTTGKDNYFNAYDQLGPLFVFINRQTGDKYQLHYGGMGQNEQGEPQEYPYQLMDLKDQPIEHEQPQLAIKLHNLIANLDNPIVPAVAKNQIAPDKHQIEKHIMSVFAHPETAMGDTLNRSRYTIIYEWLARHGRGGWSDDKRSWSGETPKLVESAAISKVLNEWLENGLLEMSYPPNDDILAPSEKLQELINVYRFAL